MTAHNLTRHMPQGNKHRMDDGEDGTDARLNEALSRIRRAVNLSGKKQGFSSQNEF